MKKLWAAVLVFWTLALTVWTVFCWNAGGARAAERRALLEPACRKGKSPEKAPLLDVPFIDQRENWPTGCESVSAVMALRYFGVEISVDEFIDGYLPLGTAPHVDESGAYVGCDPRKAFPGDPRSEGGWGCYAPVIERALGELLADRPEAGLTVENVSGESLSSLCGYVDQGIPVMTWATIGMEEPAISDSYTLEGTDESFSWMYPMHCLVLTGYDRDRCFFNDPMEGKNTAYLTEAVEKAYNGMGMQAVILRR